MGGKDQASGAHRTDEVLAGLPDAQWRVLHQVRWPGRPYATVDHVVVGPGGVFVLSSECSTGAVRVSGGVLRQDGCRRDRAVAAAADAALSVREAVGAPGDRTSVTPVLCFVRDERVLGLIDGVMVCSTHNLLTFLLSRPVVLDEEQVRVVAARLSARLERAAERRGLDRLDRRGGVDRRGGLDRRGGSSDEVGSSGEVGPSGRVGSGDGAGWWPRSPCCSPSRWPPCWARGST